MQDTIYNIKLHKILLHLVLRNYTKVLEHTQNRGRRSEIN